MKRKADMNAIDFRWRSKLPPNCRPRQLNTILETLKKFFPNCALVDLAELNKMAEWVEDEIYAAATSHSDYLHQVYLKILKMETRFQTDASHAMQSQVHNQGQSQVSLPNQSQTWQQLLTKNVQNTIVNAGVRSSTQTSMPNAAGQRIIMQSGIAQNSVSNSVNQGVPSNIFSNTQLQMPGRHQLQQFSSQQQQQQSQDPQYLYQQQWQRQQLQHQILRQKLQGNIQSSVMPSHIQQQPLQQPQNLLQLTPMSNAVGRSTKMQSEIAQNSVGQGVPSNIFSNSQYLHPQPHQILSSSIDSKAQTGQNAVDWKEEIYQKIQAMKENYLPGLNDMYQKYSIKCQKLKHDEFFLNALELDQIARLKPHMNVLERTIQFLNLPKDNIVPAMKENLSAHEKQIIRILNSTSPPETSSAQQQIQQPGCHPLSMQPQPQQEQPQQQQEQPQLQQEQPPSSSSSSSGSDSDNNNNNSRTAAN